MTDPDPNLLKSAAAYLLEVARSSKGGRFRKSAKIEALRECKNEILEAHRHGISIYRIAQIFRERNVDISTPHLMRAIRLFIAEEERGRGKSSSAQSRVAVADAGKNASVAHPPSEQVLSFGKEDFAEQLRLARYLAASSLPPPRPVEQILEVSKPKRTARTQKATTKTKPQRAKQKAGEQELGKETWRAGHAARQKSSSSGASRGEKERHSPRR